MAKISPVSIKYMIHANFIAEGVVEKPDVIGALFGQTEGLLGSELEMRELQKEGKIGRIEVELRTEGSKTIGKIEIPSALDKSETSLIAAAIETIERIGPTEAKIEIEKIEDVRGSKREYILERAKKLLGRIEGVTDSREISKNLKISAREAKLVEYGEERLPAGDLSTEEIIVVEGRADVINLLRNGVDNVIGMNGTHLPEAIRELSKDRQLTLFLDGDRGGILIAKNAIENAKISFIAFAPDGKEVEELTGKEILASLRKKIDAREFLKQYRKIEGFEKKTSDIISKPKSEIANNIENEEKREMNMEDIKPLLNEVENTKNAYLLDSQLRVIKKTSRNNLINVLNKTKNRVFAIILDGLATVPIIRTAENSDCGYLFAKNFASFETDRLKLVGF